MNSIVSCLRNLAPWFACVLVVGVISFLITRPDAPSRKGDPSDITGMLPTTLILRPDSPARGRGNTFTLVEFADFQCSSCKKAQPVLQDLLAQHADLRLVFRHCPLTLVHPFADKAARAAEIARLKGKFWEMHDALFRRQAEWQEATDIRDALCDVAAGIGLDRRWFAHRLDMADGAENVNSDSRAAGDCSVMTTPSFFLITPTRVWTAVGPTALERLRDNEKYWQ